MNPTMMIIFFVVLVGMMYFQVRTQKKQAESGIKKFFKKIFRIKKCYSGH